MPEVPGYNPEKEKTVELNPTEMEPLTAYNEEFFISHVEEGQDVLVGQGLADGDFYIRCDFSAFAEKLKVVTPEKLAELFAAAGKLEQQAPNLDEDTRKLLNSCWRTTRITRNLLGDVGSEFQRNQSFHEYSTRTVDGKKVCIKPISKSQGQAVCAEYALMAHHVLEKLGIQSSIIVGAFSENPNDPLADRHTFLVLENGKYVFDPTHSALQKDSWPPKVFTPETPLTVESLRDMETDDNKPFGRKIICTDLLTKKERIYGSGAV
ncbi:MAG: hypothetical protein WC650_02050 [Candidatus Doudnabacteria bacterium]